MLQVRDLRIEIGEPGHPRGCLVQAARRATRSGSSAATAPARPRCSRSSRARRRRPAASCCGPTSLGLPPAEPADPRLGRRQHRPLPRALRARASTRPPAGREAAAAHRGGRRPSATSRKFARAEEQFRDDGRLRGRVGGAPDRGRARARPTAGSTSRIDALSGGERRRVELARILFAGSDAAAARRADQPPRQRRQGMARRLPPQYRGALLVVSHDLELLDASITRVLHLNDGELIEYQGTYSQYLAARAADEERLRQARDAAAARRSTGCAHLADTHARPDREAGQDREVARHPRRASSKQRPGHRARSARSTIEVKFPDPPRSGRRRARPSTASPRATADRPCSTDVDVHASGAASDCSSWASTARARPASCGSSPGRPHADAGTGRPRSRRLGRLLRAGARRHHRRHVGDRTTLAAPSGSPTQQLRTLLGTFGLSGDIAFQDAGTLSGGEKTKLALAQLVAGKHNLLLLDEPTNNLDPPSRDAIGRALARLAGRDRARQPRRRVRRARSSRSACCSCPTATSTTGPTTSWTSSRLSPDSCGRASWSTTVELDVLVVDERRRRGGRSSTWWSSTSWSTSWSSVVGRGRRRSCSTVVVVDVVVGASDDVVVVVVVEVVVDRLGRRDRDPDRRRAEEQHERDRPDRGRSHRTCTVTRRHRHEGAELARDVGTASARRGSRSCPPPRSRRGGPAASSASPVHVKRGQAVAREQRAVPLGHVHQVILVDARGGGGGPGSARARRATRGRRAAGPTWAGSASYMPWYTTVSAGPAAA